MKLAKHMIECTALVLTTTKRGVPVGTFAENAKGVRTETTPKYAKFNKASLTWVRSYIANYAEELAVEFKEEIV